MLSVQLNHLLALVDPAITSAAPNFNKTLPLVKRARDFKAEVKRLNKNGKKESVDQLRAVSPSGPLMKSNARKNKRKPSKSNTQSSAPSPNRTSKKKHDNKKSPARPSSNMKRNMSLLRTDFSNLKSQMDALCSKGTGKEQAAQADGGLKRNARRRSINQGGLQVYLPLLCPTLNTTPHNMTLPCIRA